MSIKLITSFVVFSTIIALSFCDRKQDLLFNEYGALDPKADFYSDEYLNGQQYSVIINRDPCKNFIKNWQRRAVSVDTKGTCVRGCDEKDCKGNCVYLYPNHGEQKLSDIKFDKKIVSVQGCFQNRGKANDE
ncbi:hypothetical protein Ocin01_05755 [Orchesella cincta]|uniref:Uncharacterized protein n=1 Tax=Orchesella cincta TaxID=48709 RepID=A0A1D2N6Q0_ORCCI|nr:hypothetical protein Ocin01_05755 [Orchesella cincta]